MSFLKKTLASNPRTFHKPRCVYETYNGKIEASWLSNCVAYWNAQTNPVSTITELLPISIILKMKSSKQVCFINLKLFSRIFSKNILFIYSNSFTGCYDQNAAFSVRPGPC